MRDPRDGKWRRNAALLVLVLLTPGCLGKPPRGLDANPRRAPALASTSARDVRPPPRPSSGPEALAPRLLSDPPADGNTDVEQTLLRVEESLRVLDTRTLTDHEREQRDAGATFLAQAREAIRAGEPDRIEVLAGKAWVLIDSLERQTRR